MNLFREIFFGNEETFNRKVAIFHAAIFLVSAVTVYLFSTSTSFRYPSYGGDSAIFQFVGRCWAEGVLPYKEIFDHKGPLIFFIDAVGYTIYPRSGIMVPQIIFLCVANLFVWRAIELHWSGAIKIFFFLLTLIFCVNHYDEGNYTEEYSLPFLSVAIYFFLRWLRDEKNFCPPSLGFFYGLGFGACVLLRTTNGLPICCCVLLTTVLLIQARAFKNLWQNFLSFCAGFVTICLPFVIYFAAHGALYDMIYGTILYNVKYALNDPFHSETIGYTMYIVLNLTPLILLVALSSVGLIQNFRDKLSWSGLVFGVTLFFMLARLRQYPWYCEIITPLFPLIFAMLYKVTKGAPDEFKNFWRAKNFSFKRLLFKAGIIFLTPLIFFTAGSVASYSLLCFGRKLRY